MASPSPPPPPYSSALLFLVLLLHSAAASAAGPATYTQEFEEMLQSLRNYGYSLFTNGIATSDLKYELLAAAAAAANFTLFAPRDELLYALDMATDAAVYVSTLRYHVVHNRLTFTDLKNLSAPFLDTLLPDYALLIGKVRDVDESTDRASIGLIVDGVRIEYPDLFVGSRIAAHGIDGILLTGLNMSQDLGGDDDGSGHIPPLGSPAPAFSANLPPNSQFDFSPPPAFAVDGNIPAAGTQTPNSPTPPASSVIGNIPAAGTQTPDSPTPPASPSIGNIPVEGTQTPNAPTPPASALSGNIPAQGTQTPNAPTLPASEIDQNDVPAAKSASNIDWAATPTISQDQIEKMKRLGMKLPGKDIRKGRRRYRRRKALRDL